MSITSKTMRVPMVKEAIDLQVGNLTQQHFQSSNKAVRKILEDFAKKAAELAMRRPATKPNLQSKKWKGEFANQVEDSMIKNNFDGLADSYIERIKTQFPRLVGDRAEFKLWCYRIAQHAGQVAVMLMHHLDPDLLLMTDDEAAEEMMETISRLPPDSIILEIL